MRVSTSLMSTQLIAGLQEQQAELSKIQQQLSTGKKLQNASDNPIAMASILSLNQSIGMMDRYDKNIDSLESRLSLEETVLGQEFEVLTEIRSLVIRANSGTMTENDKISLAETISGYVNSMSELANTKDSSGEFLFSGYQASTKPFQEISGVFQYMGDDGIRFLQTGFSSQMQSNDSGEIFQVNDGTSKKNIFSLINDFGDKLSAQTTDPADFEKILEQIGQSEEVIISTRSSLGNRLKSLDVQRTMNDSMGINLEQSRASLRDLDYAEAITKLTAKITSLQAAQQSYAKISNISLFSYMN